MTPTVRAPPSRAARATAPIIDTRPPPETRLQPRAAIAVPTSAASATASSGTGPEAQNTQTASVVAHVPTASRKPSSTMVTTSSMSSVRWMRSTSRRLMVPADSAGPASHSSSPPQ